jgi:hypothetical protein
MSGASAFVQTLSKDTGRVPRTPIAIGIGVSSPSSIFGSPREIEEESNLVMDLPSDEPSFVCAMWRRVEHPSFTAPLFRIYADSRLRTLLLRRGQRIVLRSIPSFLLFLVCVTALSQTGNQPNPDGLKSFHDYALNIIYFYPSQFVPALSPSTTAETPKCIQSTLVASSVTPVDTSSFAISTIDSTCSDVLGRAVRLGPFTREQILRQLGQYGEPVIIQEPTAYTIYGHPAAISLASVSVPAGPGKVARTTYAAKACVLGNIPAKRRKKSEPIEPVKRVLCFDFTTQNSGQLNLMFSFIIQFDNGSLEPMFPGSAIRNSSLTTQR